MSKQPKQQEQPTQQETPNLPAVVNVGPLSERMEGGVGSYWSTLPTDTMQGKAALQRALVTQDLRIDEIDDMAVTVCHLVAQRINLVNEADGEIAEVTRLALITPESKIVSTVSEGAVNSFRQIIGTFGKPPWPKGLRVKFERKKTRKGFFTYVVSVDPAQF